MAATLGSDSSYSDCSGNGLLTGVHPIRHAAGLLLEESETNYCINVPDEVFDETGLPPRLVPVYDGIS